VTDITPSLKDTLQRYLSKERKSLLATLDGLDERQIRWPLTPTGPTSSAWSSTPRA
jgi:hypothetical protein